MADARTARQNGPPLSLWIGGALGIAVSVHAVFIAWYGPYTAPGYIRAGVMMACAVIMVLWKPLALEIGRGGVTRALAWMLDLAMLANFAYASLLFLRQVSNVNLLILSYSPAEIATATGAILTLIELTRRAFGPILALVGAVVLAYALWGGGLPGFFSHSGFDLETLVGPIWYGFQGVFGFATSTIISVVFIYIVFGAMLEGSGAGELMIRVALWATGRSRGGAGHAAILASSVFGMSSGSVVANVVGTGTVTIPLIKRRGFSPAFAGALEAAASSGGQIMPPVLGAAAFLMAQLVGLSYQSIVIASTLPALLFYFALFVSVEKEARRLGIEPLADAERPRLQPGDGLRSLMFVAPIAAILVTLALGRSTAMAGFWAVITTLVTALILNPALRQQPGKLLVALARGGYAGAQVMVAVGSIGILVGVFDLTGLGLRFAMAVSSLQTSGLLVPLLLSAAACLVLGMGMSTLPAYLIETLLRGRAICPGNASPPPGGADRNFIFI